MKPTKTIQKNSKNNAFLGIAGSKKLSVKEIYILESVIRKAALLGYRIITGDEDGTDQLVIMICNGLRYEKLTVLGAYGVCAYMSVFGENEIFTKSSPSRDKELVDRSSKFVLVGRDPRQGRIQSQIEKSGKEFLKIIKD